MGITPAAGFTDPQGTLAIGSLTALACFFSVTWLKHKLKYDDSLDAFGIHGFGGIVGALLTGVFFNNAVFGGEAEISRQIFIQIKDVLITLVYSGVMSVILWWVIGRLCGGLRVDHDAEREGLDIHIHGERIE